MALKSILPPTRDFLLKLSTSPLFTSLLNIGMLAVSVFALSIAVQTLSDTRTQFVASSQASDSLFKVQLKHSKDLNDSLVSQIEMLQGITRNQLLITDRQLSISEQTYRAQLYAGRPILAVGQITIISTTTISPGIVGPVIETVCRNVGRRHATQLAQRSFVVYPDFSDFRAGTKFPINRAGLEPDASTTFEFKPHITIEHEKDFYFCFDFSYRDQILAKDFYAAYYYRYFDSRGVFDFRSVQDDEKSRVRKLINEALDAERLPLFDRSMPQ